MPEWVSFDEIKSKVSIEDILNHYGVKLRQRRNELTGLCPFPDHDETRASFSANTVKKVFQCCACKKSGNVLDLVAQPIPGLFAAGELVGGLFYFNYPGGSGLTSGAVFGKIAGASAGHFAQRSQGSA